MNIADPQYYQMLNQLEGIYDEIGIDNIESCIGDHFYIRDCGVGNTQGYCIYCGQKEKRKIPSSDIDNSCGEKN